MGYRKKVAARICFFAALVTVIDTLAVFCFCIPLVAAYIPPVVAEFQLALLLPPLLSWQLNTSSIHKKKIIVKPKRAVVATAKIR